MSEDEPASGTAPPAANDGGDAPTTDGDAPTTDDDVPRTDDGVPTSDVDDEETPVAEPAASDGGDGERTPVAPTSSADTDRSAVSDELDVPDAPPDPETASHVLPDEKLRYPDFELDGGSMEADGSFDLDRSLDREGLREWLADLRGGLASHDVGVSGPDGTAIFGVGGGDVSVSFDPDDAHRGRLEFTFSIDAKLMTYSDDPDERVAGARGGEGFIPVEMLTADRPAKAYRCYNWIDDPIDRD
ncbi:hypothetical protein [Halovivax cerinus]|uniref:Amphi-Trp domain-containing protein n=1 Tax=Halovivax cerinus TaxID=1487865 RepID=A0ABD5NM65_9EURY|nr:hypothetical protein [Halovivax cerinus]